MSPLRQQFIGAAFQVVGVFLTLVFTCLLVIILGGQYTEGARYVLGIDIDGKHIDCSKPSNRDAWYCTHEKAERPVDHEFNQIRNSGGKYVPFSIAN